MVTAIVFINADRKNIPETAQELADIEGIAKVRMAFRTYSKHDLEHIFDIGVQ